VTADCCQNQKDFTKWATDMTGHLKEDIQRYKHIKKKRLITSYEGSRTIVVLVLINLPDEITAKKTDKTKCSWGCGHSGTLLHTVDRNVKWYWYSEN
jgi:hypothetical protein